MAVSEAVEKLGHGIVGVGRAVHGFMIHHYPKEKSIEERQKEQELMRTMSDHWAGYHIVPHKGCPVCRRNSRTR